MRSAGTGPKTEVEPRPEWHAELSTEQRASLYKPGYQATSSPMIATDGKTTRMESGVFHPSLLQVDPDSGIDYREFYFWDLNGYMVLRGVMDEEWLAAANEAVDRFEDQIEVGEELARGVPKLGGNWAPLVARTAGTAPSVLRTVPAHGRASSGRTSAELDGRQRRADGWR